MLGVPFASMSSIPLSGSRDWQDLQFSEVVDQQQFSGLDGIVGREGTSLSRTTGRLPVLRQIKAALSPDPTPLRGLSHIIKDVRGCVMVCVLIRAMHSYAVALGTEAH